MLRTHRPWSLVVSLVVAFGLLATSHAQTTTLRLAEHPGPHVQALEEHFIPLYQELTGIRVLMEVLPPTQLWQKMQLEAQGNTNYYDMGYHSPGWFGYYYDKVAGLDELIAEFGFDLGQYSQSVMDSHMTNPVLRPGEVVAIARNPQTPIYAYRLDWFDDAGEQAAFQERFGRPLAAPTTWDELYDIALFFTRPAGATVAGETLSQPLFGYSASIKPPGGMARAFLAIVYSLGLDGWDDTYTSDLRDPLLLEGVAYWKKLIQDTFPPQAQTWDFLEHLSFMREGRLATAELWPEGVLTIDGGDAPTAGKIGYATLPQWPGNLKDLPIGRGFIGGGGMLIFDTPNKVEAFQFVQWLLEEQAAEFNLRTTMFSRAEQFTDPEVLASYAFYDTFLPAFQEQMTYGFPRQHEAEYGAAMYNQAGEFAADVVFDVLTPEQAQRRWVDAMERILSESGYR